jgi:hypothetical protein
MDGVPFFLFKEFLSFFKRSILGGTFQSNQHLLILDMHGSHLDTSLTQKNIKSEFRVVEIWPFNPKVMDEKTRPNEVHTTIIIHILYQNNDSSYELIDNIN